MFGPRRNIFFSILKPVYSQANLKCCCYLLPNFRYLFGRPFTLWLFVWGIKHAEVSVLSNAERVSVDKDQSGAAGKNHHLDKKWHSLSLLISVVSFPHLIVFVWVGIGFTVGKIMKNCQTFSVKGNKVEGIGMFEPWQQRMELLQRRWYYRDTIHDWLCRLL